MPDNKYNPNSQLISDFTRDSDVKRAIQSHGIYDRIDMKWDKYFSRRGVLDPYNSLMGCKEFVFITKPDLCIFQKTENTYEVSKAISNNGTVTNAFFEDAVTRYRNVALQLQYSKSRNDGPFMNILTNALTSSLDIPGISANTIETAANIMGTKIVYRGTSYKSDEDLSFSLEFEENKYLDIYMLFKIYDEYEKMKWDGRLNLSADGCDTWINYILNRVLHDQMTIYKFIVAEDGYRILYWARLTGCFPTSVPRDAFSDVSLDSGQQKMVVQWTGHFVRDMDPIILLQFNQLVEPTLRKCREELPLFNINDLAMESRWARIPFVEIKQETTAKRGLAYQYYLKWFV